MKIAVIDDYTGWVSAYPGWDRVRSFADVTFFRDHLSDEDQVAERLADFDTIVIERERTPFPASLLRRLPRLRHLAATGPVNWTIDLAVAAERGITVSCTKSSYDETPELTWALILALTRRVSVEERSLRGGHWQTGVGYRLAGRTLGLLGLGNVGRRVAEFGACFGMNVMAWSQNLTDEKARAVGATRVDFDTLLRQSDILSVHVVLSDRTGNMLGASEFARMKPTASLVNTSRAGIIDHTALRAALAEGRLASAALDVFPVEPMPAEDPLRTTPNLLLTPHLGYVSVEQYEIFYAQAIDNIIGMHKGGDVRRLVM